MKKQMETLYFGETSRLGFPSITVVWTKRGICRVFFGKSDLIAKDRYLQRHFRGSPVERASSREFSKQVAKLTRNAKPGGVADARSFDLRGTAFQQKVWRAIGRVPCGKTLAYQEIARQVGLPKGARAIGQAAGRNPVPLLIPCHRIVGKKGNLVGFTGGLSIKEKLLSREGSLCV